MGTWPLKVIAHLPDNFDSPKVASLSMCKSYIKMSLAIENAQTQVNKQL